MIPSFNHGVLPPFIGKGPQDLDGRYSPFPVTITELASHLGRTPTRKKLLHGFLDFRAALRNVGLLEAEIWVDGGFVEQKDDPKDIDIFVIFDIDEEKEFAIADTFPDLFHADTTKSTYGIDAHFFNLGSSDRLQRLDRLCEFFGLFSHQRDTSRWKGILRVPLGSSADDEVAIHLLGGSIP